jgi:hypothetical protein
MSKFLAGTLFGIILATVGLSGIAKIVDKTVNQTKTVIEETAK